MLFADLKRENICLCLFSCIWWSFNSLNSERIAIVLAWILSICKTLQFLILSYADISIGLDVHHVRIGRQVIWNSRVCNIVDFSSPAVLSAIFVGKICDERKIPPSEDIWYFPLPLFAVSWVMLYSLSMLRCFLLGVSSHGSRSKETNTGHSAAKLFLIRWRKAIM